MAETNTIDLSYLISICDNDKTFKIEMIETFMNDIPPMINDMNESLSHKNWEEIGALAHKIKPSFTFMGINSAKQLLIDIEKDGKGKTNTEIMPDKLSELNRIMNFALEELSSQLEKIKLEE